MTFNEFFDDNKEPLSQVTHEAALRRAWENGYVVATKEMYKMVVDGLKGPKFREQYKPDKAR